jgi:hypothetical protein
MLKKQLSDQDHSFIVIMLKRILYSVQAGALANSDNATVLKKEIENAGTFLFIQDKNVAGM